MALRNKEFKTVVHKIPNIHPDNHFNHRPVTFFYLFILGFYHFNLSKRKTLNPPLQLKLIETALKRIHDYCVSSHYSGLKPDKHFSFSFDQRTNGLNISSYSAVICNVLLAYSMILSSYAKYGFPLFISPSKMIYSLSRQA